MSQLCVVSTSLGRNWFYEMYMKSFEPETETTYEPADTAAYLAALTQQQREALSEPPQHEPQADWEREVALRIEEIEFAWRHKRT